MEFPDWVQVKENILYTPVTVVFILYFLSESNAVLPEEPQFNIEPEKCTFANSEDELSQYKWNYMTMNPF